MKYYVAFDGGGSKVEAILFDENLKMIRHARMTGMNTSSTGRDKVIANATKLMDELLDGTGVTEIENVYGAFSGIILGTLKEKIKVNNENHVSGEAKMGLLAAFVYENAITALSGTGSVIFWPKDEKTCYEAGAFGSVIHDEGSGYHMARMAFAECIKEYEKRGPSTLMTKFICEYFKAEDIGEAGYNVYNFEGKDPIPALASCAPCVGKAARRGDEIAKQLLRECAYRLGEQTMGLINRADPPMDIPIVTEGGHWKNDKLMFEAYTEYIHEFQPERKVIAPFFEPIIGGVIAKPHYDGEEITDEMIEFLKEEYKDFIYKYNED